MTPLPAGIQAPDFSLRDQDGKTHSLSAYAGKWVVLYFYPKDDTPGCTVEACGFRDTHADFAAKNAAVLGVSADGIESHIAFAKKFSLPFPLLADTSRETVRAYGALRPATPEKAEGILRVTYLIDPGGRIAKAYAVGDAAPHPGEVLQDVAALSA